MHLVKQFGVLVDVPAPGGNLVVHTRNAIDNGHGSGVPQKSATRFGRAADYTLLGGGRSTQKRRDSYRLVMSWPSRIFHRRGIARCLLFRLAHRWKLPNLE